MDEKSLEAKRRYAGRKVPSMHRRNDHNDYYSRHIYMITVTISGRRPLLGHIEGSTAAQRGTPDYPHIVPSELGSAVSDCWLSIPSHHPEIELYTLQLMPDHLHAIIFVREQMAKHLGMVISGFKAGCNKAYRKLMLNETAPVEAERSDRRKAILWDEGYNDKILYQKGQLDRWKRYLEDNPYRLLLKREHKDLFRVRQNLKYGDFTFSAVGNIFLVSRPYKLQLQCSRRLTEEEIEEKRRRFMKAAAQGAVTISPSISPGEKVIMRSLFNAGYPLIFLRENGLTVFSKPGGDEFMKACAEGRLLILSPWEHHNEKRTITRSQCLSLNEIAAQLAASQLPPGP